MKKIFLLTGVMALTACSTYHTGKTGFTITSIYDNIEDLKRRLGNIIIGYNEEDKPVEEPAVEEIIEEQPTEE